MVRSTLAANDNDVVSLRSPPYRNSSNTAISAHTLPKPSKPLHDELKVALDRREIRAGLVGLA
jgi:hypothetical protein